MLVLTRKIHEKIIIGDDVYIEILHAHNGVARIGFDAPSDVLIWRKEVFDRIKNNKTKENCKNNKYLDLAI